MGLPQSHLLPLPESFQASSEHASSTSSARSASTIANTPFACSMAQRHKNPRPHPTTRRPTYGAKVISALTAIWEAAGYPCSVRLKALLPLWLPWAIKRMALTAPVQKQLLVDQPANHRPATQGKKTANSKNDCTGAPNPAPCSNTTSRSRPTPGMSKLPGFTETDLVSHSRQLGLGRVHSLAQRYRHSHHLGGKHVR